MTPVELAEALFTEARRTNERRMLVIAGERSACVASCEMVLRTLDIGISETTAITEGNEFHCETISGARSTEVMGTTRTLVVVDLHDAAVPNVIGRATGAVDGGGLLIVLTPDFDTWPSLRDGFDDGLVVAPYTLDDVGGRFKRRLVSTFTNHPGVGVVDADRAIVRRKGLTDIETRPLPEPTSLSRRGTRFPHQVYERCLTEDQARAVEAFERLCEAGQAVVVSAERGRGKSSAAGLAAGALGMDGATIAVTAPARANTQALFARARELRGESTTTEAESRFHLKHDSGGSIRYHEPLDAIDLIERDEVDVLFVDEAAGLPVSTLERLLEAPRVAFTTTRHGYEGAGHGFSVRFRARLAASAKEVAELHLSTPIRYAPNDPIEAWANRALLLDARPVADQAIEEASPDSVTYRRASQDRLAQDEQRLREVLGLLAMAHYRTQPDDLARILDAPNLDVVVLEVNAHIACVALLAREGGLSEERLDSAYRGERLRGNMLPDIFINVLRDTDLAARRGLRIVRIATHPAVRRRGLASTLLDAIRAEADVEWVGTGFGATPGLIHFWSENAFVPVSLSVSRNRASGAHSVVMLDTGAPGSEYAKALPDRLRGSLSDVHRSVDPDVALELFRALPGAPALTIDDDGWRHLTAAADGPGRYDLHPDPARNLVVRYLVDRDRRLSRSKERLLVLKVLQGHSWETVTEKLGHASVGECRRALGTALSALLDRYGGDAVREERGRLSESTELAEAKDDA